MMNIGSWRNNRANLMDGGVLAIGLGGALLAAGCCHVHNAVAHPRPVILANGPGMTAHEFADTD